MYLIHQLSEVTVVAHATQMPHAAVPASGRRTRQTIVRTALRHTATGAAALAMLHAALLGVSSGADPYPDLSWTDTTHVMSSVYILAPWPLTAVILLWLAQQRPAVYTRAALALLLFSAAGLLYTWSVPLEHLPAHESSLFREYLAMPGALTGWYLMTALAAITAISSVRTRIAVMVAALCGVTTSVLTSPHPASAGVMAAVVPLLTWFAVGLLTRNDPVRRRAADAWDPEGQVVAPRPRAHVRTPATARLGRAG
jgi:hypothetical protein